MTTCTICQQPKKRIYKGKSPNGSRKYYVDEKDNSWMGKKCPDCAKEWNKLRMREKRSINKLK